jgi:hypothetical protein
MGWERGRYYTRSRRESGRVVREYIGGGPAGAIVSEWDAVERDRREAEAEYRRALRADLEEHAAMLADLNQRCDLLSRAALIVAGYRQHKRGEWRKQRVRREASGPGPQSDV